MNETARPPDPYLSPREALAAILGLAVAMGTFFFLCGRLEGLETRDAALKTVVIAASGLVYAGVSRLFGKFKRSEVFLLGSGYIGMGVYVTPRGPSFTYLDVLPRSMELAVLVALVVGSTRLAFGWRSNRSQEPAAPPRERGAG